MMGDMYESEHEEGEAPAFQEDDYGSIDPDVSLSYIDEKIQNVLGHFKKDFEGLVSVENLGAKYGIYGSFLPTYRLSPTQSHHSKVQNNMASQSPNSILLKDGNPNSLAHASAPNSVRHGSAPPFVQKTPLRRDPCRQTSRTQSMQSVQKGTPKSDACDRKKLKVRIKVGSDTLSVKESAAIYSGLGLDGSPVSFLDGSPRESEELSLVMPVEAVKCVAQILQMMTSFPLDGGYLLSPLPYDLIQLIERPKVLPGFLTKTSLKANQENSVIGQPQNNRTISGDSVAQLLDSKGSSLQGNRYGSERDADFDLLFKETDIDETSCQELISDSLKLPFLSNADSTIGESPKASLKENSKLNPVHNRGAGAPSETVNDSGKNSNNKGKIDSKSASKRELKDSRKQKSRRSVFCDDGKNKLLSGDKKKPKKSEAHGFSPKSKAMEKALVPSIELKDKNCTETNNHACKSRSRNSSVQKGLSNSRDKYKDFFGDLNEYESDKGSEGLDVSQVVDKASLVYDDPSKQNAGSSETNLQNKIDKHNASCDSAGGHGKKSVIRNKREPVQELSGISKKNKRETVEEGIEILCVGSDYDPATNTARQGQMTSCEYVSSRISNAEGNSPNGNVMPTYPDDVCLLGSMSDVRAVAPIKRKADNFLHSSNCTLPSDKLICDHEQSVVAPSKRNVDNFLHPSDCTPSSNNLMSEKKKHRASKSEGIERSARNGKEDKRRKGKVQRSLENIESLQKDSSFVQPVLAETVSSSKNSGSLEAKSNTQELKGSPVESAWSPPRISNFDDLIIGNKIIVEKVNIPDVVKLATCSPRNCSDDDDCKSGHAQPNHAKSLNDTSSLGKDENEGLKKCSGDDKVKISEFVDSSQDKKPGCEMKQGDGKFDAHKKPMDLGPTSDGEKSQCLPFNDGEKNETSNWPQLYKGNNVSTLSIGASVSDLYKELKPHTKTDSQSRTHHIMSKSSLPNGYMGKNQDTPSPLRRDASSEAARNAIKEARNLKHLADRLKKGNGSSESTEMYFEAALKFLHGASLVESGKTENVRLVDIVESMKIYSDTAELCEFCAREYEKSKDMAMAALAYKCMEVAYMRVICISHQSASRDRDELQAVLQIMPPGESPSSSASDIDNLNNSTTGDKAPQARSTDTQISTDLRLTARNRPNFNRILSFAQNVNLAMEASRKSRVAFRAANVSIDKLDSKEGITSIKRALDFNFHDIDGLLLLVRLAKEDTNR